MITQRYFISGVTCASCVKTVLGLVDEVKGVQESEVHLPSHTLIVKWTNQSTALKYYSDLYKNLKKQGYIIKPVTPNSSQPKERYTFRFLLSGIFLSLSILLSTPYFSTPYEGYIVLGITFCAMLFCGSSFYKLAYQRAIKGHSDMNTLIALSTSVSFGYSALNILLEKNDQVYFDAVLFILFFTLLGKYLEKRLQQKVFRSMHALFDLFPKKVLVIDTLGKEEAKKLSEVQVGQRVKVRTGEKIPVDGVIIKGSAFLDENLITGEIKSISKGPGDRVHMGTINREGLLELEVQKVGEDTMLYQIIRSMEKVEVRAVGGLQPIIDRWVSVFVPVILALALLTFIITTFWFDNFSQGLLNMVNVLVISCPCALGLGPSLAVMRGIRDASKLGIYIKNVAVFDKMKKLSAIVMDKTGTLTTGTPELTDLHTCNGQMLTDQEVMALRLLERNTMHPLASAIDSYLSKTFPTEDVDIDGLSIDNHRTFSGKGVAGSIDGITYLVGSGKLMEEKNCNLSPEVLKKAESFEAEGKSLAYFAKDTEIYALMAFRDPVRVMAKQLVVMMQKKYGIEPHMLTGDHSVSAHLVADSVGIKKVMSQALPTHKAEYIRNLQSEKHLVAMIGDGVNDAPALAQSDLSIAMNSQVDIANEVSDISIVKTGINSVLHFFAIADRTQKTIYRNLIFTFLYNVLSLPIALGVFIPLGLSLSPSIASFAMFASSISVVLNSLGRKYRYKI